MTREEAIRVGKTRQECLRAQKDGRCKCNIIPNFCNKGCEYNTSDEEYDEFETLAIKILEQPPCEDCISREKVLMALTGDITDCTIEEYIARLREKLNKLPPVISKEKTGCWIYDEKSKVYRCSRCNKFPWRVKSENHDEIFTDLTRINAYKYCPNCGAVMIESSKNENKEGDTE